MDADYSSSPLTERRSLHDRSKHRRSADRENERDSENKRLESVIDIEDSEANRDLLKRLSALSSQRTSTGFSSKRSSRNSAILPNKRSSRNSSNFPENNELSSTFYEAIQKLNNVEKSSSENEANGDITQEETQNRPSFENPPSFQNRPSFENRPSFQNRPSFENRPSVDEPYRDNDPLLPKERELVQRLLHKYRHLPIDETHQAKEKYTYSSKVKIKGTSPVKINFDDTKPLIPKMNSLTNVKQSIEEVNEGIEAKDVAQKRPLPNSAENIHQKQYTPKMMRDLNNQKNMTQNMMDDIKRHKSLPNTKTEKVILKNLLPNITEKLVHKTLLPSLSEARLVRKQLSPPLRKKFERKKRSKSLDSQHQLHHQNNGDTPGEKRKFKSETLEEKYDIVKPIVQEKLAQKMSITIKAIVRKDGDDEHERKNPVIPEYSDAISSESSSSDYESDVIKTQEGFIIPDDTISRVIGTNMSPLVVGMQLRRESRLKQDEMERQFKKENFLKDRSGKRGIRMPLGSAGKVNQLKSKFETKLSGNKMFYSAVRWRTKYATICRKVENKLNLSYGLIPGLHGEKIAFIFVIIIFRRQL